MSLGTNLLGATVALMLVSVCYGGICDEGPPGEFCFYNLTGYHDCVVDHKTGKIVDKLYNCPPNTRHSRFATWRDMKNKKYRHDSREPASDEYFIVLPNNQSTYDSYQIVPSSTSCTKSTMSSFPRKFPDIFTFFKYNGTEVVTGIVSDRWIWLTGGRNSGQPINSYIWNSVGDKPLQYRVYLPGSEMTKTSRNFQAYIGLFNPGTPDPEVFELPSYCEKEFERYPKPNLENDAIFDSNWWQPS
ncbi:hypothetical protein QZH41_008912 [Actinostola sp. cb2023]|nr:hypothetical protein QZH41_008912 [Actinostola sp. cb2023]